MAGSNALIAMNNLQNNMANGSVTPEDFNNAVSANTAWMGVASHNNLLPYAAQAFSHVSSVPNFANGEANYQFAVAVTGMPNTDYNTLAVHGNAQPRPAQVNYVNQQNMVMEVYQNINYTLALQYQKLSAVAGLRDQRRRPHLEYAPNRGRDYRLLRVNEPAPRTAPGCVTKDQADVAISGSGVWAVGGFGLAAVSGVNWETLAIETSLIAASLFYPGILIGVAGILFAGYYTYQYVTVQSGSNFVVTNASNSAAITGN